MIKSITFKNWKSFRDATLYLDPLTVLIGTNASGKSNILEGLQFLSQFVQGIDIKDALANVRGGVEGATYNQASEFSMEVVLENDATTDFIYYVTIQTKPTPLNIGEYLLSRKYSTDDKSQWQDTTLFQVQKNSTDETHVNLQVFYLSSTSNKKYSLDEGMLIKVALTSYLVTVYPFTSAVSEAGTYALFDKGYGLLFKTLKSALVLKPNPSLMHTYTSISTTPVSLGKDASNIAGVLATLPEVQKREVEAKLTEYVKKLPEGDIRRVWAEPVGRLNDIAMLYAEEEWVVGQKKEIDARSMSDGTLHFLAVLTALLTQPEGTLLAIEEVDTGLHPSRAGLLLKILKEVGAERKIDVLVTTHNTALLNELVPEMFPFVTVANRDPQTGESKLTLLEDIEELPRMMAAGMVGDMSAQGSIEKYLSTRGTA
jgi:predicted ATPase